MLLLARKTLFLWFALASCASLTLSAAETEQQAQQEVANIDALIARLGADKYAERQRASRRIVEVGIAARDALVEALKHSDAEIARRARRALLAVLEADFQSRLARFAANNDDDNADPQNAYGLAGWKRFQKLAGSDRVARQQFVEMQRVEAVLLEVADQNPAQLADAMIVRSKQMQARWPRYGADGESSIPVASVTTLLLLGADTELAVASRARENVYRLLGYANFAEAISGGRNAALLKKLLGAWIARGSSPETATQDMWFALRYDIAEGLKPALAILVNAQFEHSPQVREYALLVVAKFGDRSHLDVLGPLLGDTSSSDSSSTFRKRARVEVRDVALATMIHLSGQKLKDFGFEQAGEKFFDRFDVDSLGFSTDAKRQAALAKWRVWERLQKAKK